MDFDFTTLFQSYVNLGLAFQVIIFTHAVKVVVNLIEKALKKQLPGGLPFENDIYPVVAIVIGVASSMSEHLGLMVGLMSGLIATVCYDFVIDKIEQFAPKKPEIK